MSGMNSIVKEQLGAGRSTLRPDNKPVSLLPQTPTVVQGVPPTTPSGAQLTGSQVGKIPSPV